MLNSTGAVACLVNRPANDAGGDTEVMQNTLRAAIRVVETGAATPEQLCCYADYVETMAFASAARWFGPGALAHGSREYFALADALERQFASGAPSREIESGRRTILSSMTLLASRVIRFMGDDANNEEIVIELPLIRMIRGTAERFRGWCAPGQPHRAEMLSVLVYALVNVASRATEHLTGDTAQPSAPRIEDREILAETILTLDEALETARELVHAHDNSEWFDQGAASERDRRASRVVRALQGVAWCHDMLSQVGVAQDEARLVRLIDVVEKLWTKALCEPQEVQGLLATAAHLTSAWSQLVENGVTKSTQPASRSLWLARQATVPHGADPTTAHRLIDVAQAAVLVAGVALRCRVARSVNLATRAAELVATTAQRCPGRLPQHSIMSVLGNLTRFAAEAVERREGNCPELLDQLTNITDAALPGPLARIG
ncbi:MAG: hypothetical protein EXR75_10940 [Myxococcales bacterium]|nr:hypothetical protein [Myxococcales bacterium]